jgi:2-polyprenyl-3-methyl-5-hydroxy-6-metoxy-1,4-benzoquinol methylase
VSAAPPSEEEVGLFAFQVWSYKQGEMVSLLIHLGDRLGLYRTMAGAGPLTAEEVAARSGLQERWVREWLRGQGAAGLVEWGEDDRFELTPAGAAVLADEDGSLAFAAGAFSGGVDPAFVDGLADAFRTGLGLTYDHQGPTGAHRTARMLGPWARLALVPVILPALDGVVERLEAGTDVLDIGCGAGMALLAMAEAFPASRFHGYDISRHAIERADALVAEAGATNVTVRCAGVDALPDDARFGLVLTFDCLHDMTRPQDAIAAIARTLEPDGTWLAKDIRCAERPRDNLHNPMAAMMYGFSVASCMASALSEPDGAGLGTLGLPPQLLERYAAEAGFHHFRVIDVEDPANLYYEIRR